MCNYYKRRKPLEANEMQFQIHAYKLFLIGVTKLKLNKTISVRSLTAQAQNEIAGMIEGISLMFHTKTVNDVVTFCRTM